MSLNKFELKEEHIKLIRQLNIINDVNNPCHIGISTNYPFGDDDIYKDIDLILNGKVREVNFDDTWEEPYTEDEINAWDELLKELPTALEIILFTGSFESGCYVTRSYEKNWFKE